MRKFILGLAIGGALFLSGCASSRFPLDELLVETVEKGDLVAIVDSYRVYTFEAKGKVCFLAFWPGYSESAMACVGK